MASRRRQAQCAGLLALLALLLLLHQPTGTTATAVKLVLLVQPSNATGGLAFINQPVLEAQDLNGNIVDVDDTISASIEDNPTGYAVVQGSNFASVAMTNGRANFTDLYINEQGANYTLLFESSTLWVVSEPFDVNMGPPAKIAIATQPGTATGGLALLPQPAIELQDAGGNPYTGAQYETFASVTISADPTGGLGELWEVPARHYLDQAIPFDAHAVNGRMQFARVAITAAGIGYKLMFCTNVDVMWGITPNCVESESFTVGVGATSYLTVIDQPGGAAGGMTFLNQPTVALRDAGGNINIHDSTSFITATIEINPSAGILGPQYMRSLLDIRGDVVNGSEFVTVTADAEDKVREADLLEIGDSTIHVSQYTALTVHPEPVEVRIVPYGDDHRIRLQKPWIYGDATDQSITRLELGLQRPVVNGIANFTELRLDKIGVGYRLRFTLGYPIRFTRAIETSDLYVVSDEFNVDLGPPAHMIFLRNSGDAWAGGHPFGIQPRLAIQDPGQNIVDTLDNIVIHVHLSQNPSNATLLGNRTALCVLGIAEFTDLELDFRGDGYELYYNSTAGDFFTTETLHVDYSTEWMVMAEDRYTQDRFGQAVDVYENSAVVGTSSDDRLVREIQTVTTSGGSDQLLNEIQVLKTHATHQPEIQVITTSADAGETIGGYFALYWGDYGPTEHIAADAYDTLVKVHLEADLERNAGEVQVTRSVNTACDCTNAYVWSVTFMDLQGEQPTMVPVFDLLTGAGAKVTVEVLQPSTIIDGTFSLSVANRTTPELPYNVGEYALEQAINTYLEAGEINVVRSQPDPQRGYVWSITFQAQQHNYDVPQLVPNTTLLTGNGATASVYTHRDGESYIGGSFQLHFRDAGPSIPIPYDCNTTYFIHILEDLITIDDVRVTRRGPDVNSGYTWIVTFYQARNWTEEGYVMDPLIRNLEPLVPLGSDAKPYIWKADSDPVITGMLTGTDAKVTVKYITSGPDSPPWEEQRMGREGVDAGAVFTLERAGERWLIDQKLIGFDTKDNDRFGWSVALESNYLVVGSPHAGDMGVLEEQLLKCTADEGSFTLTWREQTTDDLPFDTSAAELEAALEGLSTLPDVTVDTSANAADAVCGGTEYSTVITFIHPQDGDLEPLIADSSKLLLASNPSAVVIEEQVKGTRLTNNWNSSDASTGAVYAFSRTAPGATWEQVQKIMPEMEDRNLGQLFGWDVDLSGDVLIVSAPETIVDGDNQGAVFVFLKDGGTGLWSQNQKLTPINGARYMKFGNSLALHESTMAIGAVGTNDGTGAVHMYKRPFTDHYYLVDQILYPPSTLPATPVPNFGFDVALNVHTLVVGAPMARATGDRPTGVGYVFTRDTFAAPFLLRHTLRPTPAKPLDRVGNSVAIWGDILTLTSYQSTLAAPGPRQEVQLVRTTAAAGQTIGNLFVLGWKHRLENGMWVERQSRAIESDALASTVRAILMEDLLTGEVLVKRFGPNAEAGYRWFVTFQTTTDRDRLPLLTATSMLTGAGAKVTVERVYRANEEIRGEGFVYTRDIADGIASNWTEQAVVKPKAMQKADLFGYSMALYDNTVIIGAPNRDTFHSGVNAGAVFTFDLAFLNVRFEQLEYSVVEHDGSLNVNVVQCNPSCRVAATPARETGWWPEQLVQYSTYDGNNWGTYPFVPTNAGVIERMPAFGRWDCRKYSKSTDDCKWIPSDGDGYTLSTFDFRAIADFSHDAYELFFDRNTATLPIEIVITDDTVVEVPDETFHLRLFTPGMEPTYGSDRWATVTIQDDGDSGIGERTYIDKLYVDEAAPPAGTAFGSSIELDTDYAIVGAPQERIAGLATAGAAYILQREAGVWSVTTKLQPPTPVEHAHFGAGVDINDEWAIVAAYGGPFVCFFKRQSDDTWDHISQHVPIMPDGEPDVQKRGLFGSFHAVAITHDIAAVGSRGVETVFLYRRTGGDVWAQTLALRSSDYKQFTWLTSTHTYQAHFGASVALSNMTLVVGSPMAGYGNITTPVTYTGVEHLNSDIAARATGLVYIYQLNTTADYATVTGGTMDYSDTLNWEAADTAEDAGETPYIVEDSLGDLWAQQITLAAPDAAPMSRFGEDVALDHHQLIVGAFGSPSQPDTTWDFETGTLRGWRMTGDAFKLQPTYQDNTFARNVYSTPAGPGAPQRSNMRGRFWIGTYDNRTAVGHFTDEDATYIAEFPAGNIQGDEPQGTLTSEPFTIAGSRISFLIGGGCDIRLEYVELLVDNVPTLKATGACVETMQRVHWDVSSFKHRAAQIRIVDASSAGWAHINVDDFRFDWAMQEFTETSKAGAAYAYRLRDVGSEQPCVATYGPMVNLECEWEHQGKLSPGDKRPGAMFGFSVDVDDETGTAIVGAYEQPDVYEDWTNPGSLVGVRADYYGLGVSYRQDAGLNRADVGGSDRTLFPNGNPGLRNVGSSGGGQTNSGAGGWDAYGDGTVRGGGGTGGTTGGVYADRGTWGGDPSRIDPYDRGDDFRVLDFDDSTQVGRVSHPETASQGGPQPDVELGVPDAPSGMVYVFHRRPEERDGWDKLLEEPLWSVQQHSTVMIDSAKPGDRMGFAVAVDGFSAMVGAPTDSSLQDSAGSVTVFDTEYQRIKFVQHEYTVTENHHVNQVVIRLMREGDVSGTVSIEYSTRDVTAYGVNQTHALECWNLNVQQRNAANCGDYTQTSGVITFQPLEVYQDFTVDINDDTCYEPQEEMFIVQLSLPGGVALRGEGYTAVVRIDDNDAGKPMCPHPIKATPHPRTCIHRTYQTTTTCEVHTSIHGEQYVYGWSAH